MLSVDLTRLAALWSRPEPQRQSHSSEIWTADTELFPLHRRGWQLEEGL